MVFVHSKVSNAHSLTVKSAPQEAVKKKMYIKMFRIRNNNNNNNNKCFFLKKKYVYIYIADIE